MLQRKKDGLIQFNLVNVITVMTEIKSLEKWNQMFTGLNLFGYHVSNGSSFVFNPQMHPSTCSFVDRFQTASVKIFKFMKNCFLQFINMLLFTGCDLRF